jgi:molybdate transport system substrate-binding protein
VRLSPVDEGFVNARRADEIRNLGGSTAALASAMFGAMKLLARLLALACALGAGHAETPLTVSAAASLREALTKVQPLYVRTHPDVKLTFNFAGSGVLQQQIEAGAPVDVFISAAPQQMDALEKNGRLLAGTRRNLLTNTLVLIAPRGSTIREIRDLAKTDIRHIAVGDPKSVPAGAYAAEVIAKLELTAALTPKLVRLLDVRQVLTAVEAGNAEAGFVYRTDARLSDKVRIVAVAETRELIVYPIGVVVDSKQPAAAREFAAFLASEPVRAIFAELGFGSPP